MNTKVLVIAASTLLAASGAAFAASGVSEPNDSGFRRITSPAPVPEYTGSIRTVSPDARAVNDRYSVQNDSGYYRVTTPQGGDFDGPRRINPDAQPVK
jgi:hypothetical protein